MPPYSQVPAQSSDHLGPNMIRFILSLQASSVTKTKIALHSLLFIFSVFSRLYGSLDLSGYSSRQRYDMIMVTIRVAFNGVASSAATRNDRGFSRNISEEVEGVEKEEEEFLGGITPPPFKNAPGR